MRQAAETMRIGREPACRKCWVLQKREKEMRDQTVVSPCDGLLHGAREQSIPIAIPNNRHSCDLLYTSGINCLILNGQQVFKIV